jgi:Tol biopolymer transport system component
VAIVLRRGGKHQLHVLSSDGAELQPIAEGMVPQRSSCWSPDGSLIVYAGSNVRTFAPLLAVRPDGTSVWLMSPVPPNTKFDKNP